MIDKIENFWQTLGKKQQIYVLIFSCVLAVCLLIVLLYFPIKIQNQALDTQLRMQADIHQKIINVSKKPSSFTAIERRKAKSIIDKVAKQKGLSIDLQFDEKVLSLSAKNQEFNHLKSLLLLLRTQYAITTVKANIVKTKDGFVDADLKLILP